MANPMRTVSFKLPEQLDNELTALAKQRRSSRSALVREALQTLSASRRRSVTAAVDQLIGTVDGPQDLSTNLRHTRGYGK